MSIEIGVIGINRVDPRMRQWWFIAGTMFSRSCRTPGVWVTELSIQRVYVGRGSVARYGFISPGVHAIVHRAPGSCGGITDSS
jgi:hypothetical protein